MFPTELSSRRPPTVLHEEDMQKWPNAIYDTSTTNTSFLQYARKLRTMGVKNYRFCLVLLNPALKGVNPRDPYLDEVTKVAIWQECVDNPFYLLREVAMIKGKRYIANRGNMALMWLYLNHIDLFLIQPRQTGKSVGVDWLMIWLIYFRLFNSGVQMITQSGNLRADNIQRIKGFLMDMPQYLFVHSKDDPDNSMELGYATRRSVYKAKVPRNSVEDAEKVGRGATSATLQFDETPYIRHIKIIMQAALGSSTAERQLAIERGDPYGILYTTTAGKIDSRDGGYVYSVLQGAAGWTEHFFDAGDQPTLKKIITNITGTPAPLVNVTLSHRQLGYTDEWLWEQMAINKVFGEAADRDYFNRWTNGTGANPISVKTLEKINASLSEPSWPEVTSDFYTINWYIPEEEVPAFMASRPTVIGNDTSDAIGRDGIDVVILDVRTMRPIATGSYNGTSIPRWASFLANFMIRFPRTVWIPERKSSAQGIIDAVVEILDAAGFNPFERIYNSIVQEKEKYAEDYKKTRNPVMRSMMYETHKQTFGFNTTGRSRDLLYVQVLNALLEDAAEYIKDAKMVREMSGLVVRNGRIDHVNGGHDDSVVAYLLAGYLPLYGKNLGEYGISDLDIRADIEEKIDSTKSIAVKMQEQRDADARERIKALLEIVGSNATEYAIIRAEQEIRYLSSTIKGGEFSSDSIHEMLTSVKSMRANKMRTAGQEYNYSPNRSSAYL